MHLISTNEMHLVGAVQISGLFSKAGLVSTKGLVPVLEELLEDDGLLSLWQDLHLESSKCSDVCEHVGS